MAFRSSAVTMLLLLLPPSPLAAQQPQSPAFSEVIDVRVMNVEFVVTDLQGRFIAGLTRDDFEIYEDGKKQEITNFYAVEPTEMKSGRIIAASEPAAQVVPSRTARRIIFYFDNASLDFQNRKEIAESAKEFVRTSHVPGDQFLIATWNGSLDVTLPWSSEVKAFETGVDALMKMTAGAAAREAERKMVMTQIEAMLTDEAIANRPGGQGEGPTFEMLMQSGRRYAESARHDVVMQVSALSRLLGTVSGIEGRKVLVLAAEALAAQPGADIFQQLENVRQRTVAMGARSRIGQTGQAMSPLTEMQKYDTGSILASLGKVANAAGFTIYGINPRGLSIYSKDSGTTERIGIQEMNVEFAKSTEGFQGLEVVATQTGGLAIVGAPAPVAFAKLNEDLSSYYSIGYRSQPGTTAERNVDVRAKRSGLRVRSRKTLLFRTLEAEMADRVIANQLQTDPVNDLSIALASDPAKNAEGKAIVPLRVLVPVEKLTLLPDGDQVVGGFSVFICTGDGAGEASGVNMQTHQIRWPKEALPHLRSKQVTFAVEVPLEGKRDVVSVGVIDLVSQTTGFSRAKVR